MLSEMGRALKDLQAAAAAFELYGPAHASVVGASGRAASALEPLLKDRGEVAVLLLPDRVVLEQREVEGGGELARGPLGRLREAGVEHVTFLRGFSSEDAAALAEIVALRRIVPDVAPTPRVRFGRLTTNSGAGRASAVPKEAVRGSAATLERVWSGLERTGSLDASALDGLLVEVASAVASSASAAIPLADLKHHDEYTFIHTTNVGILAAALGEVVGLSPGHVRDLTAAALLHDLGKRRVPLEILNKKGKLDDAELAVVRRHPEEGARMLMGIRGVPRLAVIVAYEHHCHPGGGGYPRRPAGRTMHLGSRVTQIADVFDALRTNRPYRAAMSVAECRKLMYEDDKAKYERSLLDAFFDHVVPCTTALKDGGASSPPAARAA